MKTAILIALFTALAGLGDATGFQFGMLMYWLALWKLDGTGIRAVEIQTLFWFVATIVGVAVLSGRMLSWPAIDQLVAVCILSGMGWLLYRGVSLS